MRTRPIPAHSGAETGEATSTTDTPDDQASGELVDRRTFAQQSAQLEERARRRAAPAAGAQDDEDLVRSRVAADRDAAVRPPSDRPAPRR